MRALLDVNVIIALLDPDHAFHERAHAWGGANARRGRGRFSPTEKGLVRINAPANHTPQTRFPPGDLIDRLRKFAGQSNHEFWPDEISLRDEKIFAAERIHGSRQLTDLYLLALATRHHGRLLTFDKGIPLSAVSNAKTANLCIA